MNFFNLDLHASVIKDLKDIFGRMGHHVDHWSISAHAWVHGEETREAPFSLSKRNWEWLNSSLYDLSVRGLVCRVANNKYDQKYCELFTQLPWVHIPSLCGYFDVRWNATVDTFLVDSRFSFARLKHVSLVFKKALGYFNWTNVGKYAGIIVIPYNVSLTSVFECYLACIPLFFPSKNFCLELYEKFSGDGVLSELSRLQVYDVKSGSTLPVGRNDPNDYGNMKAMEHWIYYSDWFDERWMPHITYFDSFPDLEEKIRSADLKSISNKMRIDNTTRKNEIETLWNQQLNSLMKNQEIAGGI